MTFGERLKGVRKAFWTTQQELSRRTGFSVSLISRFETGRQSPRVCQVVKLCEGIGCTPDDIIYVKKKIPSLSVVKCEELVTNVYENLGNGYTSLGLYEEIMAALSDVRTR